MTTKTQFLCDFFFRMKHSKMAVIKPMMENRDHNLYQNTPYTILLPYPKPHIRSSMQITRTNVTNRHTS